MTNTEGVGICPLQGLSLPPSHPWGRPSRHSPGVGFRCRQHAAVRLNSGRHLLKVGRHYPHAVRAPVVVGSSFMLAGEGERLYFQAE